jgi:hypothetical protein
MTLLYENRQRAKRARMSLAGAVFWSLGCFYLAYLLNSGGTQEGAVALVVVIGLLPLVMLHFYGDAYIVRLVREGDDLYITTLGLIGHRNLRVPVRAVTEVARADATGLTMRLAGRHMPFLVDLQAEYADTSAINALAEASTARNA